MDMNRIIALIGIAIVTALSITACEGGSSHPVIDVVERYYDAIERGEFDEAGSLVTFGGSRDWRAEWRSLARDGSEFLGRDDVAFQVIPPAESGLASETVRVEVRWTSEYSEEIASVRVVYSGSISELERGVYPDGSWKISYGTNVAWATFPEFWGRGWWERNELNPYRSR